MVAVSPGATMPARSQVMGAKPDGGVVVDGLEVQEHILALPVGRDCHVATVPHRRHEIGMLDTAQFRFGAERNLDTLLQLAVAQTTFQTRVAMVDFELPFAVQAQPLVADELRAGVLAARYAHGKTPVDDGLPTVLHGIA
jgi:hypothetical protein